MLGVIVLSLLASLIAIVKGFRGTGAVIALFSGLVGFGAVVVEASRLFQIIFAIALLLLGAGAIAHFMSRWRGPFRLR